MHNQDTFTGASFPLSNRLRRMAWVLVAAVLFYPTPNPMHRWRAFLLRLFGAKVGQGVHIYPRVKIWAPWNLQLADQCGIANGANLYAQAKITVGYRAVISQGAHLCAGTHDYTLPGFPLVARPITIGKHAWLAAESFIGPGLVIGDGCVIAARSVVTRNMPAWTVCGGHPCKPIKERIMTNPVNRTGGLEIFKP